MRIHVLLLIGCSFASWAGSGGTPPDPPKPVRTGICRSAVVDDQYFKGKALHLIYLDDRALFNDEPGVKRGAGVRLPWQRTHVYLDGEYLDDDAILPAINRKRPRMALTCRQVAVDGTDEPDPWASKWRLDLYSK